MNNEDNLMTEEEYRGSLDKTHLAQVRKELLEGKESLRKRVEDIISEDLEE